VYSSTRTHPKNFIRPPAVSDPLTVFDSIREQLAHVVKYSQADQVKLSISQVEDQIVICLQGNGIGFAPD
jgi:signal transduction histidine kinase